MHMADRFDGLTAKISGMANSIGVTVLLGMMFLTAVDVFLRYVFNAPIEGVYEAIELMMAIVFCFGIAYTQRNKGHVSVNLLTARLKGGPRTMVRFLVALLSLAVFVLMTWQSFIRADEYMADGETTYGGVGPFGHIPIFPFAYLTSLACLFFCLELVVDLIRTFRKEG